MNQIIASSPQELTEAVDLVTQLSMLLHRDLVKLEKEVRDLKAEVTELRQGQKI